MPQKLDAESGIPTQSSVRAVRVLVRERVRALVPERALVLVLVRERVLVPERALALVPEPELVRERALAPELVRHRQPPGWRRTTRLP